MSDRIRIASCLLLIVLVVVVGTALWSMRLAAAAAAERSQAVLAVQGKRLDEQIDLAVAAVQAAVHEVAERTEPTPDRTRPISEIFAQLTEPPGELDALVLCDDDGGLRAQVTREPDGSVANLLRHHAIVHLLARTRDEGLLPRVGLIADGGLLVATVPVGVPDPGILLGIRHLAGGPLPRISAVLGQPVRLAAGQPSAAGMVRHELRRSGLDHELVLVLEASPDIAWSGPLWSMGIVAVLALAAAALALFIIDRAVLARHRFTARVLDAIPEPVLVQDAAERLVLVNRAGGRALQIDRARLIGATLSEVMTDREAATRLAVDNRLALATGKRSRREEIVRFGNGLRALLLNRQPLGEDRLLISGVDITDLYEAREQVREAEARFTAFAAHLPAGMFIKDDAGRFLYVNDHLRRIFDLDPVGRDIDAIPGLPEDTAAHLRAADRGALADGLHLCELHLSGPDGGDRHYALSTFSVPRQGLAPLIGGIALDITDRRRADAELRAAKDRAESASEAKSRFLAVMSHELRTPLTAIIGMTTLLLETELGEEQREFAAIAKGSAEALLALIRDVLDFSKIEANRLDLDELPFQPRALVAEVAGMFQHQARERNVKIACAVSEAVPETLIGDAGRLRQVFTNLVGNAVKFTEVGQVQVRIGLLSQSERGVALRCAVEDTGPGIPFEMRPRLFQPFVQSDDGMSRRHGGTGLGLAICKRLVELMGGNIQLDEAWTDGTRFTFSVLMRVVPAE